MGFFQVAANVFSHFKTKVHLHLEVAYRLTKKKKPIRYSSVSILVIAVMLRFLPKKNHDSIVCFIQNYLLSINLSA